VSEHWTIEQAAEVVGIDYDYAKEIVGKYSKYGATGLRNRRHDRQHKRGKPLLNREQIIELQERLQTPPPDQGVWTPIGDRPIATVCHRDEWTYLYGFVHPQTGHTVWLILPRVNIEWFNLALQSFATSVGAGPDKIILLVVDQAGWHMSAKVELPAGIYLEPLPPYAPELQPAERLWALADEPLVNQSFTSLDHLEEVLAQRCCILHDMQAQIAALTNFHWWPHSEAPKTG
jgi:hypothetical protein